MNESSELSLDGEGTGSVQVYKKSSETRQKIINVDCSDVKFAYGWNRFNLRLFGLWPDQTYTKSGASLITRCYGPLWGIIVFSIIVAPQPVSTIVYSCNSEELIQVLAGVPGVFNSVVKIFAIWQNGEVLAWCLSFLTDDWTRKLTSKERELMTANAKIGRRLSIAFSILVHTLVTSFSAVKSWPLFYLDFESGNATELGKLLLWPSYFPIDLSKRSNFMIMWSVQYIVNLSSGIAYTATDCFVAMLVIHLCGQIAILRHTLETVLNNDTSYDIGTFRKNVASIVKRHEILIDFAAVIEDSVHVMLLIITVVSMGQFGLQLYSLLNAVSGRSSSGTSFLQIAFSLLYISASMSHLFLYCYVGDMLIQESEGLGLASYSCKWYNLSGRDAKDLLIVMYRARAPLRITAGKFAVTSLELFGNVLKTSMSYFSVLLTMAN